MNFKDNEVRGLAIVAELKPLVYERYPPDVQLRSRARRFPIDFGDEVGLVENAGEPYRSFVGICDGLLCYTVVLPAFDNSSIVKTGIIVSNPCLKKFSCLSHHGELLFRNRKHPLNSNSLLSSAHGFCYDEGCDDYCVVLMSSTHPYSFFFNVELLWFGHKVRVKYSLIKMDEHRNHLREFVGGAVLVNMKFFGIVDRLRRPSLLIFSLKKMRFEDTLLPLPESNAEEYRLSSLDGMLILVAQYSAVYTIWVLEELGTNIFEWHGKGDVNRSIFRFNAIPSPIGFSSEGWMLLRTGCCVLTYCLKSGRVLRCKIFKEPNENVIIQGLIESPLAPDRKPKLAFRAPRDDVEDDDGDHLYCERNDM